MTACGDPRQTWIERTLVARVQPFRAFTYARESVDITPLTAPPYDVISEDQREGLLAGDAHNVVALELAEGAHDPSAPDNRYVTAARRWNEWRAEGVLTRDEVPTIYVLEQRYEIGDREVRRKAFIAAVGLEPFDAGVILPHEKTLPKALGDRYNLTVACAANFSQVFGLFPDSERATDELFAQAMSSEPTMSATDADGVVSTVWTVTDPEFHDALENVFTDRRIFIADGHHRYTTALAYRDEQRAANAEEGATPDAPAYDSVMMALANMDDPDLIVLPTHRVATAESPVDPVAFYDSLATHFDIEELAEGHPTGSLDDLDRPAFLVATGSDDRPRRMVLKTDVDLTSLTPEGHSGAWMNLDVAILQELVLKPLLGIHPDHPESLQRLSFFKDPHDALKAASESSVAFVLRPTRMDQMREVALAGETMPQKSTYFYPKLLSGLVLRGMDDA